MAQYTVTHDCGHTETVQLYGPRRERERKLAWLEQHPCLACVREAEARAAAANAAAQGLPDLVGSPKQVAWALRIRQQILRDADDLRADIMRQVPNADKRITRFDSLLATIRAQSSAAWWIDHRDNTAYELLNQQAKVTPR
ncbi:MAG: hypothetical protein AB1760_00205 [Pseudomonadota bacterium]